MSICFNKPEDLAVMNPYNQVPVLVERDLDAVRIEHYQRVYRRSFSASATDAGRSGDARARAALFLFNVSSMRLFVHVGNA